MKISAPGGSPVAASGACRIHLDVRVTMRQATHQLLGQPYVVQLVERGLPEIPIGLVGGN